MERIAGGKLGSQFVIVRQVRFVVLSQSAQAARVKFLRDGVSGDGKAVHFKGAVGLLVDIKMAFIPRRTQVFCTHGGLVEQVPGSATGKRQKNVGIVTGVDLIRTKFRMLTGNIGPEMGKVAIEGAVFL